MTHWWQSRSPSFGIALSATRLTAMVAGTGSRSQARHWSLAPMAPTDSEWVDLATALAELRTATAGRESRLAIALLPPLVQLRRIELPTMRPPERRRALSRQTAKYLPGVREPQFAMAEPLARTMPAPHLMVAAPARVIDAIVRAAEQGGWEVATIISAHTAWTAAAYEARPGLRTRTGHVVVPVNAHTEILEVQDGHLTGVRRVFSGAQDTQHDGVLHGETYTIDEPDVTAARFAPGVAGPELLPERVYALRAAAQRQSYTRAAISVAVLIVLAAVGVLAHARYTLRQIQKERASLGPNAQQAAAAQEKLTAVSTPLTALGRLETRTVLWSQVLADLSDVLPGSASISSLRGTGDSMIVSGTAARGAEVFERADGAKLISKIQSSAPIRREVPAEGSPVDRFEFTARVPSAVPLYTVSKGRGKRS
jgi:Tfp pilus assembly protein PilN